VGIDRAGAIFLGYSKRKGASFRRTLTFGRQGLYADLNTINDVLTATNSPRLDALPKYCEPFLAALGAETIDSLDASSFEQSTIVHDLNAPLPERLHAQYTAVLDLGTIEHVFNAPAAFKSAMEAVAPGGHFIQVNVANNFTGHGFWQFSPELLYRMLAPENGFEVETMFLHEVERKKRWFRVLDPKAVGRRVTFRNSVPTYVLTVARRTKQVAIFPSPPQQSDYVVQWEDNRAAPVETRKPSLPHRAVLKLRRLLRSQLGSGLDRGIELIGESDLLQVAAE